MDLNKEVFVIVSDHGNIEDLSIPTHTMNPVPVFFITNTKTFPKNKITAITDILPAVLDFFRKQAQAYSFKVGLKFYPVCNCQSEDSSFLLRLILIPSSVILTTISTG